jgi:hypothetical protein
MFGLGQIYLVAPKFDPFGLQSQTLFESSLAR